MHKKYEDLFQFAFSNDPLYEFNQLRKYQEIGDMWGVKQDSVHHPEIFLEIHTAYVILNINKFCRENNIWGDRRLVYMLSALLHDFSKPETCRFNEKKQKITFYGHDIKGAEKSREFLKGVFDDDIVNKVSNLIELHMAHCRPESYWTPKSIKKFRAKLKYITGEDLIYLMRADSMGRPPIIKDIPQKLIEILK